MQHLTFDERTEIASSLLSGFFVLRLMISQELPTADSSLQSSRFGMNRVSQALDHQRQICARVNRQIMDQTGINRILAPGRESFALPSITRIVKEVESIRPFQRAARRRLDLPAA